MFISRQRQTGSDLIGRAALCSGQGHGDDRADAERGHDQVVAGRGSFQLEKEFK